MALFKPILGELSGKIAGNVFAHNRGGSYVRAWKVPTNPNTELQQSARAAMAALVVAWGETLTDQQRTDWDTYGANVAWENRLGETIYLTGQNHYIRSNVPRLQASLNARNNAPEIFNLGSFANISLEAWAEHTLEITFDDQADWCTEIYSAMIVQI